MCSYICALQVESSDTIKQIKKIHSNVTGIPIEHQKFLYRGLRANDNERIERI
jgi:hypothetical protein